MRPPPAWSHDDMTDLERRLLEGARSDRVPNELQRRMARALSITQAIRLESPRQVTAPATQRAGRLWFSRSALWGSLTVVGLIAGAGLYTRPHGHVSPHRSATVVGAEATSVTQPSPASAPLLAAAQALAPAPTQTASVSPTAPRRARSVPRKQAVPEAPLLHEELALLDSARDALRSNAAARALHRLDEYDRRFRNPALRPEAQALRIEAYARAGERARARTLFASFERDQPGHPLVPHLSELMAAVLQKEPELP